MNSKPGSSTSRSLSQMAPVTPFAMLTPQVVKVEPKGMFNSTGDSDSECRLSRKVIALMLQISQQGPGFKSEKYNQILLDPLLEGLFTQELTDALCPVLRKWLA